MHVEPERTGIDDHTYRAEIEADVENQCMDTKGEQGCGVNWETGIDMYVLLILYMK